MGKTSQWRRWAPPTYTAFVVLALAVFPAWITIPVAAGIAVLYLMFSPVAAIPPSTP
jgi:hypothetical protein